VPEALDQESRVTVAPPLELIVDRPSGGPLTRAYLADDPSARPFFGPHFGSLEAYVVKAREVSRRFDRAARQRAVECVSVPTGADASRLERFVADGGFMVTTGQQPGLFGGPLYNLCKALTAVRLAEALEERLAKPVLPLFWVSSEDHDWAEASQSSLIGPDNHVHTVRLAPPHDGVTPSLHRIALTNGSSDAVKEFVAYLPKTEFSAEYVTLLEEAFGPGRTISE
jgi:hypothetical protein